MISPNIAQYREDEAYEKCIASRRLRDKERCQRIFNPRLRLMSVDVSALDAQTKERKAREAQAALEEAEQDSRLLEANRLLTEQEREYHRARLSREREVALYNLEQIKPEFTKEFDLYDPNILRKEKPIRMGDNDPRLGVSSGQIFDGEDLHAKDREKAQIEDMRISLEAQTAEKQLEKERKLREKQIEDSTELEICNYLREKERIARADEALAREEIARENIILAQEKLRKEKEEKVEEERLKKEHMTNYATSHLMSETPTGYVKNNVGVPITEFKGYSAERISGFLKDMEEQNKQHRDQRRKEIEDKIRADALEKQMLNTLSAAESVNMRTRRQVIEELAIERANASAQENERRANETRNAFGEINEDEFYKYFQKTAR